MSEIHQNIIPEVKDLVTPKQAWYYRVIPVSLNNDILNLEIEEKRNINGVQKELEIILGKTVVLKPVDTSIIEQSLQRNYPNKENLVSSKSLPKLISNKDQFIHALIKEAQSLGSSDIHFEIRENNGIVRYRIDGHLISKYSIPKNDYPAVVNAIKIKSNLDIAEKRLPQDGRIQIKSTDNNLDIRVSIIPTNHGEKIVFRLLNKDTRHINLEGIGFSEEQLNVYEKGFLRSHGMILVSGPTGSGKTTTLYATLQRLNKENKNILTIEDPIEYTMEGVNQVQLKENIGLTFPLALKTFLRQDPDIIMIGEIRDPETAQIAIRAALTGHLVLSTIHTNSAWGIISRLIDMQIPEYLISATLNIAAAQRLVRMLCHKCKVEEDDRSELTSQWLNNPKAITYKSIGCEKCNYTGYKGRKALFEVIDINEGLREIIKSAKYDNAGYKKNSKGNTLSDQAIQLYQNGVTSFAEILPILLNT